MSFLPFASFRSTLLPAGRRKLSPIAVALLCGVMAGTISRAQVSSRPDASVASSPASSRKTQAAAGKTEEEVADTKPLPNSSGHQGVKVHGHWKIDVRNPDGSLASSREFENSLNDNGFVFSQLLAGTAVLGEPAILIGGHQGSRCSPLAASCVLASNTNGIWAKGPQSVTVASNGNAYGNCQGDPESCSFNLKQTATASSFTLSGSLVVTWSAGVSIGLVSTNFPVCFNGPSPADGLIDVYGQPFSGQANLTSEQCSAYAGLPAGIGTGLTFGLTLKQLATFVPVVNGQMIMVSVTLSFS